MYPEKGWNTLTKGSDFQMEENRNCNTLNAQERLCSLCRLLFSVSCSDKVEALASLWSGGVSAFWDGRIQRGKLHVLCSKIGIDSCVEEIVTLMHLLLLSPLRSGNAKTSHVTHNSESREAGNNSCSVQFHYDALCDINK